MNLSTVQEIEQAIDTLKPDERAELFDWLESCETDFDARIAADLEAGRLDRAIAEALSDVETGRTRPL